MQSLLVIAAAGLAAATFVLKDLNAPGVLDQVLSVAASVSLAVGMFVCLFHIRPTLNSGVGNEDNPRSVIGTVNRSKAEYLAIVQNLSKDDMLRHNANQIYGLATINTTGQRRLAWAIHAVGAGLIMVFLAIGLSAPFLNDPVSATDGNATANEPADSVVGPGQSNSHDDNQSTGNEDG